MKPLKIVGIGGGTGLPVLLRGLRRMKEVEVSAIVSVADNGGSSGRLRQSFAMPAVGDLRNCLVALSGNDSVLVDLFQHRFSSGNDLEGHSLGNLIVTALYQMSGEPAASHRNCEPVASATGSGSASDGNADDALRRLPRWDRRARRIADYGCAWAN